MRGADFPEAFPDAFRDAFPTRATKPISVYSTVISRLSQKYCNGSAHQAGILVSTKSQPRTLVSGKRMWAPSNEKTRS